MLRTNALDPKDEQAIISHLAARAARSPIRYATTLPVAASN
jgi:hypothetical protein